MALGGIGSIEFTRDQVSVERQAFYDDREKINTTYKTKRAEADALSDETKKRQTKDVLAREYLAEMNSLYKRKKTIIDGLNEEYERKLTNALNMLNGGIAEEEKASLDAIMKDLFDEFIREQTTVIETSRKERQALQARLERQNNTAKADADARAKKGKDIEKRRKNATGDKKTELRYELQKHNGKVIGQDYYQINYNTDVTNRKVQENSLASDNLDTQTATLVQKQTMQSIQFGLKKIADLNGDGDLLSGRKKELRKEGVDGKTRRSNKATVDGLDDDQKEKAEESKRGGRLNEQQLYKTMDVAFASIGYGINPDDIGRIVINMTNLIVEDSDKKTKAGETIPDDIVSAFRNVQTTGGTGMDKFNAFVTLLETSDKARYFFHECAKDLASQQVDLTDYWLNGNLDKFQQKETADKLPVLCQRYAIKEAITEGLKSGVVRLNGKEYAINKGILAQFQKNEQEMIDFLTGLIQALDDVGVGMYYAQNEQGDVAKGVNISKSVALGYLMKYVLCSAQFGLDLWKVDKQGNTGISQKGLGIMLGLALNGRRSFGNYRQSEFRRNAGVNARIGVTDNGDDNIIGISVGASTGAELYHQRDKQLEKILEQGPDGNHIKKGRTVEAGVFATIVSWVPGEDPKFLNVGPNASIGIERNGLEGLEQVKQVYQQVSEKVFTLDDTFYANKPITGSGIKTALTAKLNTLATKGTRFEKAFLRGPRKQKILEQIDTMVADFTKPAPDGSNYGFDAQGKPITTLLDAINNAQNPKLFTNGLMLLIQSANIDARYDTALDTMGLERGGMKLTAQQAISIAAGVVALLTVGPVGWVAIGTAIVKMLLGAATAFRHYGKSYLENVADTVMDNNSREYGLGLHEVSGNNIAEKLAKTTCILKTVAPGVSMYYDENSKCIKLEYTKPNNGNKKLDFPPYLHQAINISFNDKEVTVKYDKDSGVLLIGGKGGKPPQISVWVQNNAQGSAAFLQLGSRPTDGTTKLIKIEGDATNVNHTIEPFEAEKRTIIEKRDFDAAWTKMKQNVLRNISDEARKIAVSNVLDTYVNTHSNFQVVNGNLQIKDTQGNRIDLAPVNNNGLKLTFTIDKNNTITNITRENAMTKDIIIACEVEGGATTSTQVQKIELTNINLENNEVYNTIRDLLKPFYTKDPNRFVRYLSTVEKKYDILYKKFLEASKELDSSREINDTAYIKAAELLLRIFKSLSNTEFSTQLNTLIEQTELALKSNPKNMIALIYLTNRMKTIFAGSGTDIWNRSADKIDTYRSGWDKIQAPSGETFGDTKYTELQNVRKQLIQKWKTEDPTTNIAGGDIKQLNGCGLTARYRPDGYADGKKINNKGISMTAIGDTYYDSRFMHEFASNSVGASQAKEFFINSLKVSKSDQIMIATMLKQQLKTNAGIDVTDITPDNLVKLMNGEKVALPLVGGGSRDVELEIGRCMYLLGECRNESVGFDLKGIKVGTQDGYAQGFGTDSLDATIGGLDIMAGFGNTSSSKRGKGSTVGISVAGMIEKAQKAQEDHSSTSGHGTSDTNPTTPNGSGHGNTTDVDPNGKPIGSVNYGPL